jgi:hypothetical protein
MWDILSHPLREGYSEALRMALTFGGEGSTPFLSSIVRPSTLDYAGLRRRMLDSSSFPSATFESIHLR